MIFITTITNIIKKTLIVCACLMLWSGGYIYHYDVVYKNNSKIGNYALMVTKQYEAYMESLYRPIDTFYAELTGYGADCEGCTGLLGCKFNKKDIVYVQDNKKAYAEGGAVYINDPTYGKVRIVAADWDYYPCGTIMRFQSKRFGEEPVIAVVMDKGGDIVNNRLDLLTIGEDYSADHVGRVYDLKVDILRKGWK